ncbi:MAG: hypothetical protein PVG45_09900 [Gammaproteobacteria bacterium]|jgi:hypothetical protein
MVEEVIVNGTNYRAFLMKIVFQRAEQRRAARSLPAAAVSVFNLQESY